MHKSKTAKRDATYWIYVTEDHDPLSTEFTCLRPCYSPLKKLNAWFKGDYKNAVEIVFEASIAAKKHDETLEQFMLRLVADGQRVDYILHECDGKIIKVEDESFNLLYRCKEQKL